ncbi:ankyrin repeat, partial [Paramuricea clavata]
MAQQQKAATAATSANPPAVWQVQNPVQSVAPTILRLTKLNRQSNLPSLRMVQQQKTATAASTANPPALWQVQVVTASRPTILRLTKLNRQVPAVNKVHTKSAPTSPQQMILDYQAFSRLTLQQQLRILDQNPVLQKLFPELHAPNLKKKRDFSVSKDPRPYARLKGQSTSTSAAQPQGQSKARSSISAVTSNANLLVVLRASKAGNFQEVKRFVESGGDVKEKDDNDNTVLHYAACSGSLEIVKYVVERGAEVNCLNVSNTTPLHYGVNCGSLEMVKYLIERGAMVTSEHKQGNWTVLYLACYKGNHLIVDYLLQHGAIKDIDSYDDGQPSPLSVTCIHGHTAVVQTLLKYNVDIRRQEKYICGNDEILNILKLELKKSIKHEEKIQALKAMDGEKMRK